MSPLVHTIYIYIVYVCTKWSRVLNKTNEYLHIEHFQFFMATVSHSYQPLFSDSCFFLFPGLITTTARKLDRENQSEHILEVCNLCYAIHYLFSHMHIHSEMDNFCRSCCYYKAICSNFGMVSMHMYRELMGYNRVYHYWDIKDRMFFLVHYPLP